MTIQADNSLRQLEILVVRAGANLLKACSMKGDGLPLRLQA